MTQDSNRFRETEAIEDIDAGVSEADRDVRISAEEGDDLPVTPPDMRPRGTEAAMAGDAGEHESIEARIAQEEPDPDSAYGAPRDESGLDADGPRGRVGGDDPDSIPVSQDVLGDSTGYDDEDPNGERMAPGYDTESAEEAAMHVESEE